MNRIKIQEELSDWLVDYITNSINGFSEESHTKGFIQQAQTFKKEDVQFVVNAEFINDWDYDEREDISEAEAKKYADALIKRITYLWK